MNNLIFAIEINAILDDDTEVSGVIGLIYNNERIYKLADGTVLTGTKKIKTIKSSNEIAPAELLINIMSLDKG